MTTTVYSKKGCYGCIEAKNLLQEASIPFTEVQLNDVDSLKRMTSNLKNNVYFPRIVMEDKVYSLEQLREILQEDVLKPNPYRFSVFPVTYNDMWFMYKKAVASFWTVEEIDMSKDRADWELLKPEEQHFLKHILAFFANADGVINENLSRNFMHEVQIPEARQFYSYQAFNEAIHSETYAMLIDSYVTDPAEKAEMFDAIHKIPSVRRKARWAQKWMDPNTRFAQRLIAFVCVEGIMFSGSFCAIFWMKKRGLLPGLSFSNELISRDEGLHMDFGVLLYNYLNNRLDQSEVEEIIGEAVQHEKEFIREAVPCRLIGMNSDLMSQYIEFVADRLLKGLGYATMYGSKNPFDFMENICLEGKTNFFEKRVGEYAKAGVAPSGGSCEFKFDLNEDF
jgi:ribonucleotide reductase beta subunit family protein with ferritin-like domain